MNLPIALCIDNAKVRPWEPHKYASKEAQHANLAMLVDWIKCYADRSDTFSERAHKNIYDLYAGNKRMYTSNRRI